MPTNSKSTTNPLMTELKSSSAYVLTHQEVDKDGAVSTSLIKVINTWTRRCWIYDEICNHKLFYKVYIQVLYFNVIVLRVNAFRQLVEGLLFASPILKGSVISHLLKVPLDYNWLPHYSLCTIFLNVLTISCIGSATTMHSIVYQGNLFNKFIYLESSSKFQKCTRGFLYMERFFLQITAEFWS